MTKPLQLGLISEGDSRFSHVLHLRRLRDDLGPVKSSTFPIARRLCNFLRAGYAVTDYEELQSADLILIRVPDGSLPRVIGEMCRAGLPFSRVSFVLCESWLTTDSLAPLRIVGSTVATLMSVPTAEHNCFIVEGETAAVRGVKQLMEHNNAHVLEIRPGSKALYFASELLATTLAMPLLIASQQALRAAGVDGKAVTEIAEEMMQYLMRGFVKGVRTMSGGPLKDCNPEVAAMHLDTLRRIAPELAQIVDSHLPNAERLTSKRRSKKRGPA